jgi:phosphatidylethanolamine-binding protein (PEBP) family uncharacterized protein
MQLTSQSFPDGGAIPGEFAFAVMDAAHHVSLSTNRNPHLAWSDVPKGTKSFVLICHDSDVPSRADDVNKEDREIPASLPRVDFFHWLLIDIPANAREISPGSHPIAGHYVGKKESPVRSMEGCSRSNFHLQRSFS